MKKFSAKRVFSIIGIVFGSATAFIGAVLGVMALMGKFKTPIVYPTALEFLNNNQVVVEQKTFKTNVDWTQQDVDIFSFELSGVNEGSKHEVNKKNCYIWFYQNIGADLITLCDENGRPLKEIEGRYVNEKYKVNCNEPIYYMINEIDNNAVTDGRVQIWARSENNKAQVDSPLTFWIDREVQGVFVDTTLESQTPSRNPNVQNITAGVDIGFDFKYVVDTPLSLKPIAKESAKEIELYYVATGYSTDFVKVTKEEVENTASPLNKILTYNDGVFNFKSTVAGQHTFKIAIFPTYQAKTDYLASISGLTIDNPNFHRTNAMTLTTLTVNVENIDVSEAGFMGSNVVLNLYSQNDYITLDGISGVDGAKDNNLELYMRKGEGNNVVADYSRFDEVSMVGFAEAWADKAPVFVAQTDSGEDQFIYENALLNMSVEVSNLSLGEKLKVINYLYRSDDVSKEDKYYCTNGVAVYNTENQQIQILKAGSYLNFYAQDENNNYRLVNFDYTAEISGLGQTKSWKIVTKDVPVLNTQIGEELRLGILVVNNHGEFKINQFFDTIPVTINEVDLKYTLKQEIVNLDITFGEVDIINCPSLKFENLVQINAGSYDACVFITRERVDDYIVKTIPSIKFNVNNTPYVLVGDVVNNEFKNVVKVNTNVSSTNNSCDLVMLQIKNAFGQTIDDIINAMLEDLNGNLQLEKIFADTDDNTIIKKLHNESSIKINSKYILNEELLNYEFYDVFVEGSEDNILTDKLEGVYAVYEDTIEHTIIISSMNVEMIDKIVEFYAVNESFFTVSRDNIVITSVTKNDNGQLIVKYDAKKCLSDERIVITISIENVGTTVNLPGLFVLSGSPDVIILNTGALNNGTADSEEIVLSSNENAVDEQLTIIVGYDGLNGYTYTIKHNENIIDLGLAIFNTTISSPTNIGFQGKEDKGQTLPISYSADTTIFNTEKLFDALNPGKNLVEKSGTTTLIVTIGETAKYLKIQTITDAFNLNLVDEKTAFDKQSTNVNLGEMVSLKHNTEELALKKDNLVFVENVKCVNYGDGALIVSGDRENGYTLKKNIEDVTPILTIADDGSGWKFAKTNLYISLTISFDVVTIAGTENITLTFSSAVDVSVNSKWTENRVFYAGTKVLMHSNVQDQQPVFVSASDISFVVKNATSSITINTNSKVLEVPENLIGNITIQVFIGETKLHEFVDFEVRPNVLVNVKKNGENDKTFESETSYAVSEIYDLRSFKDITYGDNENSLYTSVDATGELVNITPLTELTTLSAIPDGENNTNPILSWDATSSKLEIKEMVELGVEKTRKIHLFYKEYLIASHDIKINNKNAIVISNTGEQVGANQPLTFKAMKEYDLFASVDGYYVSKIEADGLLFNVLAGKFFVDTAVVEDLEAVDVTITFTKNDDSSILEFQTVITVLPYTPDEKEAIEQAFSETQYDLFASRYDEALIANDANIKELVVVGIKDKNNNDITSNIISGQFAESGYYYGEQGANCEILFNKIAGDELKILVEYRITYSNNLSFTYVRELVIKNRQAISVHYPESDQTFATGTFKFLAGYEQVGADLSGEEYSNDGVYTLTNKHFETAIVYTGTIQIIDFKYDNVKKHNRSIVENRKSTGDITKDETNLKITLIGYENNPGMADYVERVNTTYNTNQVALPTAIQGMFGTILFKLETNSGNFEYYYIYIYCVGAKAGNLDVENNLEVVAFNTAAYPNNFTQTNITAIQVDNTTTYSQLIEELSKNVNLYPNVDGSETFETIFKTGREFSYNTKTTSLYLYNVSYSGETLASPFEYNGKQCKKIEETDTIVLDEHFNTVTIGLLYQNGVVMYVYGTITIYVQPINNVEEINLTYSVPNGEFNSTVNSNETVINCPFGGIWDAEIVSIDAEIYDEVKHENFTVENSSVKLIKRVSQDTIIRVKYTQSNTTTFVNYTYKATYLPTVQDVIEVGKFVDETTGFKTEVELVVAGTYVNTFFGSYEGNYLLSFSNPNVRQEQDKLIFTQTTTQQTIDVTFVYSDFDSVDNYRVFTFDVKAGVSYQEVDESQSGLSTSRRKDTSIYADAYESNIGSTLEINYEELANGVSKFVVGGLTIYTNEKSLLRLTFDENSYVLKYNAGTGKNEILSVNENIDVSSSQMLNFTHSAAEHGTPIEMYINILKSDYSAYSQRRFYINVISTYSTINAKYLVSGAEHENVKSYTVVGDDKTPYSIADLHNELFGGTVRLELLGIDGNPKNANFEAMGFTTEGNPNNINFSVGGGATIRDFATGGNKTVGIVFNIVSINTLVDVYMNNNAGMAEAYYTYQIMAGDYQDGLDYSQVNGIYDENDKYISYLLNDTDKSYESEKFVIGSMLDQNNTSILSLSVDGVWEDNVIKDDFSLDGETSNKVGEYFDAIQYKFTNYGYNFFLTYDRRTSNIELIVMRPENKAKSDNLTIKISLGGVNGEKTIVDGLTIILSNLNIYSEFEKAPDTSIYSGFEIDLTEKILVKDKDGNNIADGGLVSYVLDNSEYTVDGQLRTIEAEENNNDLFKFNPSTKIITTLAVGSDVSAKVAFVIKIKIDGVEYSVKETNYNFVIKLNMQFVVNGESLSENIGNTSPETNFVITTSEDADTTTTGLYPITIPFVEGSKVAVSGDDKDVNNDHYRVLAFDLYRLQLQGQNVEALIDRKSVLVELHSQVENGVLNIGKDDANNYVIIFNKDYTGDVELKLSVKTDNGTYYVIWTIHVFAVRTLTYASANPEFARIQKSSLPFSSGDTANIISATNGTGVGVVMTSPQGFPIQPKDLTITATYEYKIHTFNTETSIMTNKQLFEDVNTFFQGNSSATTTAMTSNNLNITLPSVPSTTDQEQQTYLVTYKIYLEYLNLEHVNDIEDNKQKVKIFYVSYEVKNRQQVSVYKLGGALNDKSSADIFVDGVNQNITSPGSENLLDLFYYVEKYSTATDYIFTLEDGLIVLTVGGDKYNYNEAKSDDINAIFTNNVGAAITYSINDKILYDGEGDGKTEIKGGTWKTTPNYIQGKVHSVFAADFTSIFEYQKFIDKYYKKESVKLIENGVEHSFTLIETETGRYGIDLGINKLFNNEMRADLSLIHQGIKTITIPAYSSTNSGGFRLTTESKIVAKTNNGEGIKLSAMFLPSYFKDNDTTDNINLGTAIIGVGAPSNQWMKDGKGTPGVGVEVGPTIKIPSSATTYIEYKLKEVEFSAGGSGLYNLTQNFYYIDGATATCMEIVVPDYNAVGIESTFFKVTYIPNADKQEVDLSIGFKAWYMLSGSLSSKKPEKIEVLEENISNNEVKFESDKLIIQSATLDAYKKQNPNKRNYPVVTTEITIGSYNYFCEIVFALADYVQVGVNYDSTSATPLEADLVGNIYIPTNSKTYELLTNTYKGLIQYVDETSYGDYVSSYEEGKITLDKDKIKTYFEDSGETYLYITLNLTTINEDSLDFQIVVKKVA